MNIRICTIGALAIGAIFIIIGILSLTIVPLTVSKEVIKNEHLGFDENNTYNVMTRRWIKQKYSMKLKIWTVSVANPYDVVRHGSYPTLVEKGPYVYTEYRKRVKVNFMQNNTRVLFRNKRYYIYNENESCANCSLNDLVTVPNVMFQYVINIAAKSSPVVKELIKFALKLFKRETPFIRVTVKQMLFEGYEDPMIEWICNKNLTRPLCILAGIPTRIKFMENGTDSGEYLIDTGLEDNRKIGQVYAWNGRNETPWWSTAQARKLNGTNGELFSPFLSSSNDLSIFLGELGRSLYLHYDKSVTHERIPSYRYIIPSAVYDPFLPENKGFCNQETPRYFDSDIQPEGCLPAGMFDIGRTKVGSPPIYLSGVHFYQSPPQVYQNFTGFQHPDSSDASYIDIEPYTGVIVSAFAASQINIGMISSNLYMPDKMPSMIVPVMWMKELINMDEDTKNDLQKIVFMPRGAQILGIVLVGAGLFLWSIFLIISLANMYLKRDADDETHLIEGDVEN
ncbi:CD36 family protein [Acanthocheilonema viteae]